MKHAKFKLTILQYYKHKTAGLIIVSLKFACLIFVTSLFFVCLIFAYLFLHV